MNKGIAHARATNTQTYQRPTDGNLRKSTSLLSFSTRLRTVPIAVTEVSCFAFRQITFASWKCTDMQAVVIIGNIIISHYVAFSTPVNSSVLGTNFLLSTLFSNTLSLRSSHNVSDQVSHPYKKKGNFGPARI